MIRQSMDFFNKMQSGFLMSRITNDTRMMQTALSSISSDLFKQPIAIIGGDQRAALHGLEIYPRHPRAFPELPRAA